MNISGITAQLITFFKILDMDLTPYLFAVMTTLVLLLSLVAIQDNRNNMEWSITGSSLLGVYWAVNNVIYYVCPLYMFIVADIAFSLLYAYVTYESRKFFIGVITLLMMPNVILDGLYLDSKMTYSVMMYWENWLFFTMLLVAGLNGCNVFIGIYYLFEKIRDRKKDSKLSSSQKESG